MERSCDIIKIDTVTLFSCFLTERGIFAIVDVHIEFKLRRVFLDYTMLGN